MQALRAAFFLLVFGNLLLFAFGQGYFGQAGGSGEAERLKNQIEPEKIRTVSRDAPPKPAEPPPEECRALTGLPTGQAQRLVEWLRGRDAQLRVNQRALEEPTSWWVFIPPQQSKRQAEKKADELKKISIADFYVVQESGPGQFAISLGLFKTEQGAREYLDVLGRKGVRSARIQVRESVTDKAVVEARGAPDKLSKALADLPADFASASAAAAECAPAK
jgi:hypothetical protein